MGPESILQSRRTGRSARVSQGSPPRACPRFLRVLASRASMAFHRLALALALLATISPSARPDEAHLTILHTTDLHGNLSAWDYLADRPAPRGLTRVATLVRRVRAEGTPVMLL